MLSVQVPQNMQSVILGSVVVKVFRSDDAQGLEVISTTSLRPGGAPTFHIATTDPARAAELALRGWTYCEHIVNLADLKGQPATVHCVETAGMDMHLVRCDGRPMQRFKVQVGFYREGLRTDVCWAQRRGDERENDGTCEHEIEAASEVDAERLAVFHHVRDCQPVIHHST